MKKVEMDLAKDLFRATITEKGPTDSTVLAAIAKLGFEATVFKGKWTATGTQEMPNDPAKVPPLIAKALAQAKIEGKLVLVDFTAVWCGPCKKMIAVTFKHPKVAAELKQHYVKLIVDTDKQPDVARFFKVKGIPDARILTTDGKQLKRVVGFWPPAKFLPLLQAARKSAVEKPAPAELTAQVAYTLTGMT